MNETVLIILLSAGVLAVIVTIWYAVRYPAPKKTGEGDAPGQPQEGDPVPGQPEQPRKTAPAPMTMALTRRGSPRVPHSDNGSQNVAALLQTAYDQLKIRQDGIESELARIEMLRGEQEKVAAQVSALDAVMRVFSLAQSADCHQLDPQSLASNGNGSSLAATMAAVREKLRAER